MSLKTRIQEDMKAALRAGDRERLSTIRMALAAIKNREIDQGGSLEDPQITAVLAKMVKQYQDAASQYESGGRRDLAAREEAEIDVLRAYLPEPLSDVELDELISEVISATGAGTLKDMGKVMGHIKSRAQGRVDMAAASARVRKRLSA